MWLLHQSSEKHFGFPIKDFSLCKNCKDQRLKSQWNKTWVSCFSCLHTQHWNIETQRQITHCPNSVLPEAFQIHWHGDDHRVTYLNFLTKTLLFFKLTKRIKLNKKSVNCVIIYSIQRQTINKSTSGFFYLWLTVKLQLNQIIHWCSLNNEKYHDQSSITIVPTRSGDLPIPLLYKGLPNRVKCYLVLSLRWFS